MNAQANPIERASDALRHVAALTVAAQLIASGNGLPSQTETDDLIYNLLEVSEFIAGLGRDAMNDLEALDRLMKIGQGAHHA